MCSLLCGEISLAFYVTGIIKDGLLCLFSVWYELQNNNVIYIPPKTD